MKCVVANRDFTFLSLMGMETVVCGMDGDGCCRDRDDVETIVGIGVRMGMRVVETVRNGYKYLSPYSSLVCIFLCLPVYTVW